MSSVSHDQMMRWRRSRKMMKKAKMKSLGDNSLDILSTSFSSSLYTSLAINILTDQIIGPLGRVEVPADVPLAWNRKSTSHPKIIPIIHQGSNRFPYLWHFDNNFM